MRVLVSTSAGEGHFGPLAPFATALRDAGHDVAVAAPASFAGSVAAAGFELRPFADVPRSLAGSVFAQLPNLSRHEADAIVGSDVFAGLNIAWALPALRRTVAEWRPDVILREPTEYASYVLAQEFGIPQVLVPIGLAATTQMLADVAVERLSAFGAPDGCPGLTDGPTATWMPASMEDPAVPGPERTRRYAPTPAVQSALPTARSLPDCWPGSALADHPLLYVSFGTVAAAIGFFPGVYRGVLDALDGLDVRVLITTGRAGDPTALGTLPPNVHAEQWVPQADVLAQTAVLISHGGYGTMLGALAAGIPQVALPLFSGDQYLNSARLRATGAGIELDGPASLPDVRGAIERILAGDCTATVARTVAAEIAAQEPLSTFPDYLTSILSDSGAQRCSQP